MSHRHIQFALDGITVVGVSLLAEIETDRPELLYLPETEDIPNIIFGWRYIDGEWLPPLPPTEEQTLEQEIATLNTQLTQIYQQEQYAAWLGVDADSDMGKALLPEPMTVQTTAPEPAPNLLTAFAQLAGTMDTEAVEQVQPDAQAAMSAFTYTVPVAAPTKAELLEQLKNKVERLAEIKE